MIWLAKSILYLNYLCQHTQKHTQHYLTKSIKSILPITISYNSKTIEPKLLVTKKTPNSLTFIMTASKKYKSKSQKTLKHSPIITTSSKINIKLAKKIVSPHSPINKAEKIAVKNVVQNLLNQPLSSMKTFTKINWAQNRNSKKSRSELAMKK